MSPTPEADGYVTGVYSMLEGGPDLDLALEEGSQFETSGDVQSPSTVLVCFTAFGRAVREAILNAVSHRDLP